ncbi:hypothetical protein A8926_4711 [Saccharopolyspora spinosa]|uniref:Uncharacterized protein n=1 Tax=Saccharopolyspora spinosa TaxID=60894 RepID=A0A2N3Y1N4_SACSN|nr:hypothetical protein A8926_4711 [Saccharopolyspora spinosa]
MQADLVLEDGGVKGIVTVGAVLGLLERGYAFQGSPVLRSGRWWRRW